MRFGLQPWLRSRSDCGFLLLFYFFLFSNSVTTQWKITNGSGLKRFHFGWAFIQESCDPIIQYVIIKIAHLFIFRPISYVLHPYSRFWVESNRKKFMGYVLRVRFASFFAGAAVASAGGFYFLHKDYKIAHQSISQQVFSFFFSFSPFYLLLYILPI